MSLHKFAEQVAAQGRGDDSLLVHMTPDEVRNLQRFAQANGTTLTINPITGLPEAGLLSDLFKAVAPIALGAFLGPAGLGMSSMMAGVATGGITTLATGSLSRGLMAGLGAYGGAGLGASLAGASGMTGGAALGAGVPGDMAFNLADAGVAEAGIQSNVGTASKAIADAQPSLFDKLGAGAKNVASSSESLGSFAKQNLGNLAYAAAPIMAGAMVPTTTKLGDPKDTGLIRQMAFNINPDTGKPDPLYGIREMTPVKASEFGNKTFQGQRALFYKQNPNPYELGVGSLNQPPQQQAAPMASGGIVALAGGGIPGYADGALVSDAQIFDYFKGLDQGQINSGALDAKIAADMQTYNVSAADIARATGTQANQSDFEDRFVSAVNTPGTSAQEFLAMTSDVGLTGQALENAMQNAGMSQAAQYAATHGLSDASGITGPASGFYNQFGYKAGALPGDQGGLEGYYSNINYSAQGLQSLIDAGKMTGQQAREAALTEMNRIGMSAGDLKAATGKTLAELFPDTKTKIDTKTTVTGGTGNDTITGGTGITTVTPQPFTSVIPGGFYGNATNPGDITTNPDGTVTVHPNIPYRPYGGFSGMEEVRGAYTKGGGSLGYTAKAPRTMDEFNRLYNRQTGDSLAAYDYLMGKGGGKYPVKSGVPRISENYADYVLGKKTTGPRAKITDTKTVVGTPGNPQTYFDEAAYLAANPDVAEELRTGKSVTGQPTQFTSGYQHYLMYGKAGGRPFTGDYEGYLTAAALANAAGAGGGGDGNATSATTAANAVSDSNTANSITGLAAPANQSITVSDMGPASTASPPGETGESVSGDYNNGGMIGYAMGGGLGSLGSYSDGGRLLKGPGDGVSDSIPATIGAKQQPARLADGEFVIPARIVSELGNGSTDAGAKKLYAMMDRVQRARGKTTGKNKVAANSRADKYLPA